MPGTKPQEEAWESEFSPCWCGLGWLERHPVNRKVVGSAPGQGTCPGCGVCR